MTPTPAPPPSAEPVPRRFMADPQWAANAAAPMGKLIGTDREPSAEQLQALARGLTSCDPVGAALADAIGERDVTFAQFRQALAEGVDAVPDAPRPLADFFAHVDATPDWVDQARLKLGAEVMRRGGVDTLDVFSAALLTGYRSSANTKLLTMTGGLSQRTLARNGETSTWVVECIRAGGMARTAQGWQLTVHVRLMHAIVNRRYAAQPDWDLEEHGLPINATDQAGNLGLLSTFWLLGIRLLGMPVSAREAAAVMHLWRYIGWLVGVEEQWLPHNEAEGRRVFYHISLTAPPPDKYSRELTQAFEASLGELSFPRFECFRRAWELRKVRSLSRLLVGKQGMKDIEMRRALPWYPLLRAPANFLRHGFLAQAPPIRRTLLSRGERQLDEVLRRYFKEEHPHVAPHSGP
ncbi:oxygenase MpaB family protein [Streptomyces sp. A1499]|uniref:oxygenase MpaB family protein n=1 Tax=Streptomyces sp. A1499 TaxID=2563104 RepID=UPI00144A94AC|nr:oxygenase MpaB family protein [Streptomyces sp. A1499]